MSASPKNLLVDIYVDVYRNTLIAHTIFMREDLKKPLLEVVRIMGITLAVYLTMRYLLPLVIPFLIAFLLAKLLHPLVRKLHKRTRLKEGFLSAVILLLLLLTLLLVLWFAGRSLVPQLKGLFGNFPIYQEKLVVFWDDCCTQIEIWTGMNTGTLKLKITEAAPEIWENMKGTVLPGLIGSSFSWVKGILMAAGILIVTAVSAMLMVKGYDNVKNSMEKSEPGRTVLRVYRRVYRAGGGYVKAQLLIMLAVSAVCVIGLFFTGNPYAVLAGMGIGLCDALPFLGTGTIFIPWAVLEMIGGKYMLAASYAVIYVAASLTRELLEPKLVGGKLGIHPLAVIVSVYLGLCIYGLWGFALGPVSYILIREIWSEVK